jgi:hypothetical protein
MLVVVSNDAGKGGKLEVLAGRKLVRSDEL